MPAIECKLLIWLIKQVRSMQWSTQSDKKGGYVEFYIYYAP